MIIMLNIVIPMQCVKSINPVTFDSIYEIIYLNIVVDRQSESIRQFLFFQKSFSSNSGNGYHKLFLIWIDFLWMIFWGILSLD